jgi:hypothetical protein
MSEFSSRGRSSIKRWKLTTLIAEKFIAVARFMNFYMSSFEMDWGFELQG